MMDGILMFVVGIFLGFLGQWLVDLVFYKTRECNHEWGNWEYSTGFGVKQQRVCKKCRMVEGRHVFDKE